MRRWRAGANPCPGCRPRRRVPARVRWFDWGAVVAWLRAVGKLTVPAGLRSLVLADASQTGPAFSGPGRSEG